LRREKESKMGQLRWEADWVEISEKIKKKERGNLWCQKLAEDKSQTSKVPDKAPPAQEEKTLKKQKHGGLDVNIEIREGAEELPRKRA